MSDKPLAEKLGFAAGDTVFVEDTPDWYSQFADDNGFELTPGLPATHAHIFCRSKAELDNLLKDNDINDIEKSLWLSWLKKVSGVKTDVSDQTFRDIILPLGWVDIKVVAIDDTWSGVKFLRRKSK